MKRKYCAKCGKETTLIHNGFNAFNGEEEFIGVCPSNLCGHEGIYHPDSKCVYHSLWDRLKGICENVCETCGASKGWKVD